MKATGKGEASSKPAKKTVRVLLDKDVVAWLKKDGWGWNMRANQMLREEMMKDLEGGRFAGADPTHRDKWGTQMTGEPPAFNMTGGIAHFNPQGVEGMA